MARSEETFQEFLDRNSKIVASWPEWKRKILTPSYNTYGEPSSYADYAHDYYKWGHDGIEITEEFPELSRDEAIALLAKNGEFLRKSAQLRNNITYTLGPNGIEETIEMSDEEALRILRNYDRLLCEDRTNGSLTTAPTVPVQPMSKKEQQVATQKIVPTRADQLQMELDQDDKIVENKEAAADMRFSSLELD